MTGYHRHKSRRAGVAALSLILTAFFATGASAETLTQCTTIGLCYCVNKNYLPAIHVNTARVRKEIAEQRTQHKAIGYLSIPLSTVGGSYSGVNADVAGQTKQRIENRFGQHSVWVLNPGAEGDLPSDATGADYMYMWTEILEGPSGLGEDFDFFYFVGPSDYARFFVLSGKNDMEQIDAYFDKRLATDSNLRKLVLQNKVSKIAFRNYYALRASVSFSFGSHDEWNIARLLNARRRAAADLGISREIAIWFDGRAVPPGNFESGIAAGDAGRCSN
jgi:hypothetical protein